VFARSAVGRSARGRVRTPVPAGARPGALLRRFTADLQAQLIATLRFLAPITTAAGAM